MIVIEVKGIGRVTNNLNGYARNIPKAGRRGVWLFANSLSKSLRLEAKARGHTFTGYLSSEKGTHPKKIDQDTWAVVMPYYIKHIEEGTSPHWIPRYGKTVNWARRRGMSFETFNKLMAGKAKGGIGKGGATADPFVNQVINRELKNLKKKVEEQINNTIKQAR